MKENIKDYSRFLAYIYGYIVASFVKKNDINNLGKVVDREIKIKTQKFSISSNPVRKKLGLKIQRLAHQKRNRFIVKRMNEI